MPQELTFERKKRALTGRKPKFAKYRDASVQTIETQWTAPSRKHLSIALIRHAVPPGFMEYGDPEESIAIAINRIIQGIDDDEVDKVMEQYSGKGF